MEFINKMKKREFIEMGLKALAGLLAAFLAIILMEGMIYGIQLNAYKTSAKGSYSQSGSTIAYCIKEDDDKYFVLYYNENLNPQWYANKDIRLTEDECKALEKNTVAKVIMHAPSAFEFTINGIHYVVMAIFVAAVAGFFVYKFIALAKQYKKIEEEFKSTGTISFS